MNPDLAWWGRSIGVLAAEGFALVLIASLCIRLNPSALWRRWIWQCVLVLLPLVWALELTGAHGYLALHRPSNPTQPQITVRTLEVAQADIPFPTSASAPVPDEAPAEVAPQPSPVLWPALLWAIGFAVYFTRILSARVWIALQRFDATPTHPHPFPGVSTQSRLNSLSARLGLDSVRLGRSNRFRGPVALGILRPTIVVPVDFEHRFPPDQRDAMLAHELAHLQRRDPLWLLIADMVCAAAWWHPASWWIRSQFRAACEQVADEASTVVPGGRMALAEALISFGRELAAPAGLGVAGSGLHSDLSHRVQALLAAQTHVLSPGFQRTAPMALLTGSILVLLALLTSPAAPNPGGFKPVLTALQFAPPIAVGQTKPAAANPPPSTPSNPTRHDSVNPSAPLPSDGETTESPTSPRSPNVAESSDLVGQNPTPRPSSSSQRRITDNPTFDKCNNLMLPAFSSSDETLEEAIRRISDYARLFDPEREGVNIVIHDSDGFDPIGRTRVGTIPRFGNISVFDAVIMVVSKAEIPLQLTWESFAVMIRRKVDTGETLYTRTFKVAPDQFNGYLKRFLPPGKTGDPDLGLATLAWFESIGVSFPTAHPLAPDTTPSTPAQNRAAFTYNPRGGMLFARSTLVNLTKIERALAQLEKEKFQAQIKLTVHLVEVAEGGQEDFGLDWLFGQTPTNNPVLVSEIARQLPGSTNRLQGDRLRLDRFSLAGQSTVLSQEQFTALQERMHQRSRLDFLTAPKVITQSGQAAQVSVNDIKTLVTGIQAVDGSSTNDARIAYISDSVPTGIFIHLTPSALSDAWNIDVAASVTEFLGYDEPGKTNRVVAKVPGAKSLKGLPPQPRLRVRETQSAARVKFGEVIALRGPLAENIIRHKSKVPVLGDVPGLGRLFRNEGSETRRTRLYVFVVPESAAIAPSQN